MSHNIYKPLPHGIRWKNLFDNSSDFDFNVIPCYIIRRKKIAYINEIDIFVFFFWMELVDLSQFVSISGYILQDSWCNLAHVFANEKSLFLLNTAHQVRTLSALILWTTFFAPICVTTKFSLFQRSLAQTLVCSASGLINSEASNLWVFHFRFPSAYELFICRFYMNLYSLISVYIKVHKGSHESYGNISKGIV